VSERERPAGRWTRFVKGHGTENDFVVLPDAPPLDPQTVRALCDRRAGLGADGVLRVDRGDGGFVMDYWNADGSLAEMCGNGVRVFGRYLVDAGLAEPGTLPVGTRAGVRTVQVPPAGDVTVEMGAPVALEAAPSVGGRTGTALSMGNPHVVVELPDLAALDALDLSRPPDVWPPLPDGQNVEWVVRRGPRALAMRVHERGVGETRSCGTGVCAAVVAAVAWSGGEGLDDAWTVDVPGGRLTVTWLSAGPVLLSGPAVLVARGEVDLAALSRR
jgi:diaminopimelate epimerase